MIINYHSFTMRRLPPTNKIDQVRHAILGMIFDGSLSPGERLVEARLASQLGVSQATINVALQDLHSHGVVTKLPNRSTNVNLYTRREIDNLFAIRLVLEPVASAAAARNLTAEGVAALQDHVEAMRAAARSGKLSRFCVADYQFHQEIYAQSGNSFLIQACQAIAAAPFAYILCGRAAALPTNYLALAEDHAEIVLSLEAGPEAAEQIARDRIEAWRLHSLHALESLAGAEVAHAGR